MTLCIKILDPDSGRVPLDKYTIPAEFKEDIPGEKTYQKYAEYLPDL